MLLVDLDGIGASIACLVLVPLKRSFESALDGRKAMVNDLWEAEDERGPTSSFDQIADHISELNAPVWFGGG